ncbi:MAG: undecaprenyl-diphosphate phosphatase [Clostridia bacterium]|nr:undecaprenyl-diphosphate phosphatase [Clostridia bacterium]
MNYIYGCILGLIQGLGEFLPISSSGHLEIVRSLMHLPKEAQALFDNGALDVLLHLGTLLAVFIAFRKTVWGMITGFIGMIVGLFKGTFKWRKATKYQLMAVYVILATVPLLAVPLIGDYTDALSDNLLMIGSMLIVTAALLFLGTHSIERKWTVEDMKPVHAIKLGLFQLAATLPGLSRSGTTISMASNMGFDRSAAVEFSFMMSIPAVVGANILKLDEISEIAKLDLGPVLAAVATAAVAGVAAIALLRWLVKKDRFGVFVYYCLGMGVFAIIWHFVG